ncbi:MAG: Eco57I restriction-modification methylase domain-containing protein [Opitutales bacterium]
MRGDRQAKPLEERVRSYGLPGVIRLDAAPSDPAQVDYLDLLPRSKRERPELSAVAEHQGTALLYLVDAEAGLDSDNAHLRNISNNLANRSEPAWLGVVRPGSLEIYPVAFRKKWSGQPLEVIHANSEEAPVFFQSLVHGTFRKDRAPCGADYVFQRIYDNLTETARAFVYEDGKGSLDALEVLSMTGRALFFRFLLDRSIVREPEHDEICPSADSLYEAFSTPRAAAETSAWLDDTFNGDFLPLGEEASVRNTAKPVLVRRYRAFFDDVEKRAGMGFFNHLYAILRGWPAAGGAVQLELDWGELDFAHIPVGVLSQVYESFSHLVDRQAARDTSVHYTPRLIADLMVDEAFAPLEDPANARILDPSCGAGIFLVLAFRRLFKARWEHDEERPRTNVIQNILYNQICGFDVSEPALRLAALALYITAIELNASPRPPKNLKFPRNLRGEVLHRFGDDDSSSGDHGFVLGSLGPEVSAEHDGCYDIVIGNPPWTRLRESQGSETAQQADDSEEAETAKLNKEFTEIGKRVLTDRGLADLAKKFTNPDKNPDIPFLWRATVWAKENGVIALAMPARLFGRTSGIGLRAWQAILRSVSVTGLINGADLRKTAVWEGVDMPFCLFFARNKLPVGTDGFYYLTPSYDPELNKRGRFRIDYESAKAVTVEQAENQPWILKTLSLGTWLDVEIMKALTDPNRPTLKAYWKRWDPKRKRTGKGYSLRGRTKEIPPPFPLDRKDFEPPSIGWRIKYEQLKSFLDRRGKKTIYSSKGKELYEPPLVIIPQSPGQDPKKARAFLAEKPVAFSQSYYGYSCAGHPEADALASLIYLLPQSTLFAYFCLMTSRRSGFDRQTFNKEEFEALPFPEIEELHNESKTKIREISRRLREDAEKPWDELDAFIFQLYGMDADAVQVARDTLYASAYYRRAGREALEITNGKSRAEFLRVLADELNPYFDVCGERVEIGEITTASEAWIQPWFFLSLSKQGETVRLPGSLLAKAMDVANQHGSSRILVRSPRKTGVVMGLLNQNRWWTATRARLCAQHIIREHIEAFGLAEDL